MKKQIERGNLFNQLHVKGEPLILFNIWDAESAKCVEKSGAKAIATSSWSVAATYGYKDGEKVPLDLVIANNKRIVDAVELPVTVDFEGGYASTLAELGKNILTVIDTGIVGINVEDQIFGKNSLYSTEEQCNRISVIRRTAKEKIMPLFINARTDIFLQADLSDHTEKLLEEALRRVESYAVAGADGFFVPGLSNMNHIAKLCDLSPIPINVMLASQDLSVKVLKDAGVARVSYGPTPFFQVMNRLKENACAAISSEF